MTDHCSEELSSLLSGELGREETHRVVAHLRECGECTGELVSVAVAYGSLRAARRAEESLSPSSEVQGRESLEQPPLHLPLAKARRRPFLVAAAALVVVVAVGLGLVLGRSSPSPIYALATLHHMDAPATATGRVTVRSTSRVKEMGVTTTGLPALPANHYYEVWLLQPQTNKMLPVGLLPPSGQGTYAVSGSIMSQYSAVDISLQTNNGDPAHSRFSVLRGNVVPTL
jgi:hypothetical protein